MNNDKTHTYIWQATCICVGASVCVCLPIYKDNRKEQVNQPSGLNVVAFFLSVVHICVYVYLLRLGKQTQNMVLWTQWMDGGIAQIYCLSCANTRICCSIPLHSFEQFRFVLIQGNILGTKATMPRNLRKKINTNVDANGYKYPCE